MGHILQAVNARSLTVTVDRGSSCIIVQRRLSGLSVDSSDFVDRTWRAVVHGGYYITFT